MLKWPPQCTEPGDVVDVEVVELNTDDVANLRGWPVEQKTIRQWPFAKTGWKAPCSRWPQRRTVRSMVGGIDIYTSEFNRATQSKGK